MKVYMEISKDEYQLTLVIADSVHVLARKAGTKTINDILWIIGILAIIAGSAYIAVVGVGICVMVFNLWRDRREK